MRRRANDIPAGAGTGSTSVRGDVASHELAATGQCGVAVGRRALSTGPVVGAAEPAAVAKISFDFNGGPQGFLYYSASDLLDSTPELARIGRQPRRSAGETGDGGNGGPAVQTTPYNTGVVGTDTEVWISVPTGLVDIQTLVLIQGGTPFFTAFSPMPGTTVQTTWPGMAISGAIDEVKIQNGAGEDIAVGVFDPTLPDPAP